MGSGSGEKINMVGARVRVGSNMFANFQAYTHGNKQPTLRIGSGEGKGINKKQRILAADI